MNQASDISQHVGDRDGGYADLNLFPAVCLSPLSLTFAYFWENNSVGYSFRKTQNMQCIVKWKKKKLQC